MTSHYGKSIVNSRAQDENGTALGNDSGMKRSALLALPFSSCNLTRSKISLSLSFRENSYSRSRNEEDLEVDGKQFPSNESSRILLLIERRRGTIGMVGSLEND